MDLAVFDMRRTNEKRSYVVRLVNLGGGREFAENYQPAQERLAMLELQQIPFEGFPFSSLRFYRRYLTEAQ